METDFFCKSGACAVETDKGKLRGYRQDHIYTFKGIPYARAKRFHAPEEVDPWRGELDATTYGFVCRLIPGTETPHGELQIPHRYWFMSEHCQNLNVWTPALDAGKRPVIFWMHGGGFEAGSSIEQEVYDGKNMAKYGGVVVVSINHRINLFGYFDLSAYGEEYANSGNAGMDDIIMALKWVKKNIASFGGDPDNVVLMGQSGGGTKVSTLLQMPAADGLYHKGLIMSGVIGPFLEDSKGLDPDFVDALLKELSISTVKELEEVDEDLLVKAYGKVRPAFQKAHKSTGGTPTKNAFYLGSPEQEAFRRETAQIPLMIGSVFGEFFGFGKPFFDRANATAEEGRTLIRRFLGKEKADTLLALFEKAYPNRNPGDLLTMDNIFRYFEIPYVEKRSALNASTYVYLFDQDMPIEGGMVPWHCADIPHFFHNTCLAPVTAADPASERLEKEIFGALMAFARTGNPNHPDLPTWHASAPGRQNIMVFGSPTEEKTNFDLEVVQKSADYTGPTVRAMLNNSRDKVLH